MSTQEIIAQLPKLNPDELRLVKEKLGLGAQSNGPVDDVRVYLDHAVGACFYVG